MDKNSNAYSLTFAAGLCFILALFLAGSYEGVKGIVDANVVFDKQTNVLIALGLYQKGAAVSRKDLQDLYKNSVRAEVLEVIRGPVPKKVKIAGVEQEIQEVVVQKLLKTEHELGDLAAIRRAESKKAKAERKEFAEFYRSVDAEGNDLAYAIPISGYGLWSTLYGYLGIEKDKKTVKGITFYEHKETPGLGGEVDNQKWQESWKGKTFMADGKFKSIWLKKGTVSANDKNADHMVDGLSGATITSNGVSKFIRSDLTKYLTYLDQL